MGISYDVRTLGAGELALINAPVNPVFFWDEESSVKEAVVDKGLAAPGPFFLEVVIGKELGPSAWAKIDDMAALLDRRAQCLIDHIGGTDILLYVVLRTEPCLLSGENWSIFLSGMMAAWVPDPRDPVPLTTAHTDIGFRQKQMSPDSREGSDFTTLNRHLGQRLFGPIWSVPSEAEYEST